MAELKTKATAVDPAAYIAAVANARRRRDAEAMDALLREVTGEAPRMWGPSIIGYGAYRYTYDSGRSGEMCRIGFAPRASALVLYASACMPGRDGMVARLGPVKTGVGCIYIADLSRLDLDALRDLCTASWAEHAAAAG